LGVALTDWGTRGKHETSSEKGVPHFRRSGMGKKNKGKDWTIMDKVKRKKKKKLTKGSRERVLHGPESAWRCRKGWVTGFREGRGKKGSGRKNSWGGGRDARRTKTAMSIRAESPTKPFASRKEGERNPVRKNHQGGKAKSLLDKYCKETRFNGKISTPGTKDNGRGAKKGNHKH